MRKVKRRRKRRSLFDAFAPEVLKRWQAGEHNGLALFGAIQAQGYTGSERTRYRYLEPLKQAEVRAAITPQRLEHVSAKTAVWLFVRAPTTLDEVEQEDLAAWGQVSPTRHSGVSAGARVSGHGASTRRAAFRCLVGKGGQQHTSRTAVLCRWGGARQRGGASGLNVRSQQRPNRGAGDQSQAPQTLDVWEGRICAATPTSAACWVEGINPLPRRWWVIQPDGSKIKAHGPIALSICKRTVYIKSRHEP
jgi:hypothetical protein